MYWPPSRHEHSASTCPGVTPFKQKFLLDEPIASSNSYSSSTLISAIWFIKICNRVFPVFPFPHHCNHWWGPGFESFLGAGSWSWQAVVSKHLQSAADLPLSPACMGRQWNVCFCAQHLTLRAKGGPPGCGTCWAYTLPTPVGFV